MILALGVAASAQTKLSLQGVWEFQIDSLGQGIDHQMPLADKISLPGTMDDARKGNPTPLAIQLQKPQVLHLTRRHTYTGPAWYKRQIDITPEMAGKPLRLNLERVLWQSRVWVDGKEIGDGCESLTTPHTYIVPPLDAGSHTLAVRIDNTKRYDISVDNLAHAYTNDTQVMWNGILGDISLSVVPDIEIADMQIYPDIKSRSLDVALAINNRTSRREQISIELEVDGRVVRKKAAAKPGESIVKLQYAMPSDAQLWDEFNPKVYTLNASLPAYGASKTADFGLREVSTRGDKLLVNDRPVFLRGTLECCIFPLAGTPPTDAQGWLKVFETAREYGLNHLRFHSWCPPEAAFQVADSMGFYLQVELPQWTLAVGSDPAATEFVRDEFHRISRAYGNHPSWIMMTCGNELQPDFDTLNSLVQHMQASDPRRLYSASTFTFEKGHGKHQEPYDQFFITQYTDLGWVRGQGVFDAEPPSFDKDYGSATAALTVPLVSHEIGQYAVYPNLREIDKYVGTLVPLNFMAVRDDLISKGLIDQADDWTLASGKLAALLYKEEIERAMKSPGFSGFQLLDLHDFPGQGTALVGLLDAFWDSKGIIAPQEFRQFCAPAVVLSKFAKAEYADGENFDAEILISNFSDKDMAGEVAKWSIVGADGRVLASGEISCPDVAVGEIASVGRISPAIDVQGKAERLDFCVEIEGGGIRNQWPIWAYPQHAAADIEAARGEVVLTDSFDAAREALSRGCKVLFSPKKEAVAGLDGKFVPVFWSPVHFPDQAGAMGVLCDPAHPALGDFPTEMHTNWQWWHLLKNSKFMVLDDLAEATPIVSLVDNFANNRRLAGVIEARVGDGQLLMSSFELLGEQPSLSQQQLLYSLLRYANSPAFNPSAAITPADLDKLSQNRR